MENPNIHWEELEHFLPDHCPMGIGMPIVRQHLNYLAVLLQTLPTSILPTTLRNFGRQGMLRVYARSRQPPSERHFRVEKIPKRQDRGARFLSLFRRSTYFCVSTKSTQALTSGIRWVFYCIATIKKTQSCSRKSFLSAPRRSKGLRTSRMSLSLTGTCRWFNVRVTYTDVSQSLKLNVQLKYEVIINKSINLHVMVTYYK